MAGTCQEYLKIMISRAAQYCLAGRLWPVGRRLESPEIHHFKRAMFLILSKIVVCLKLSFCWKNDFPSHIFPQIFDTRLQKMEKTKTKTKKTKTKTKQKHKTKTKQHSCFCLFFETSNSKCVWTQFTHWQWILQFMYM